MLLRSPDLGRVAHEFGAYPRFRSTVRTKLNELAIMMSASFWRSEFVWFAHRRAAQGAGLSPAVGDAIAAGQRPASLQPDEEAVYNFCDELLNRRQVSDATYARLKDLLGRARRSGSHCRHGLLPVRIDDARCGSLSAALSSSARTSAAPSTIACIFPKATERGKYFSPQSGATMICFGLIASG